MVWWNPWSEKDLTKRLPLFYFVVALLFGVLFLDSLPVFRVPQYDIPNASALILELGFAVAITWTVYVYSKKQNEQISDFAKEQKDIKDRKRERYAEGILGNLEFINSEIDGLFIFTGFLKKVISKSEE